MRHAQLFHGPNIGPKGNFTRYERMGAAVAWQKNHAVTAQVTADERIGGVAEGGRKPVLLQPLQAVHLVQAAATDDAEFHGFFHGWLTP